MGQLHVRYADQAGLKGLAFAVERLKDGQVYDFLAKPPAFRAPVQGSATPWPLPPTLALPERFPGSYEAEVDASTWPDGNYVVKVTNAGLVIKILPCSILGGDDAVTFPTFKGSVKATIVFDPE